MKSAGPESMIEYKGSLIEPIEISASAEHLISCPPSWLSQSQLDKMKPSAAWSRPGLEGK
jgi:hypothetical protein